MHIFKQLSLDFISEQNVFSNWPPNVVLSACTGNFFFVFLDACVKIFFRDAALKPHRLDHI